MKNSSISPFFRTILFVLLLGAALAGFDAVCKSAPALTDSWPGYLKLEENSLDVLVIGSSHAYCTVAPLQIYQETGIKSWVLAGSSANTEQKLAMLKEGFRTQRPKLVLCELWTLSASQPNIPPANEAVYRSFPAGMIKFTSDLLNDYLVPSRRWRERPYSFSKGSFDKLFRRYAVPLWAGGSAPQVMSSQREGDAVSSPPRLPDTLPNLVKPQDLAYLREMAELCRKNDAQLVFFMAPVASSKTLGIATEIREAVRADPYLSQLSYCDMNEEQALDQMELVESDFRDRDHLYLWGMKKATAYLTNTVLKENLDLSGLTQPESNDQWWDKQSQTWSEITTPTTPQAHRLK
jgi:hypothetical protein